MGLICVSLTERSIEETIESAKRLDADIIEVRLDFLEDTSQMQKLSSIKKPVMATCMPVWEGGNFMGDEEERLSILKSAVEFSEYVSLELTTNAQARDEMAESIKKAGAKVVITSHDFQKTPPVAEIVKTLRMEEEAGADIAKVAYAAKNREDAVNILLAQLTSGVKIPVIAVGMGEAGTLTRVVGPMLGGYLTFASPSNDKKAAPGQLTIDEMKSIRKILWNSK